MSSGKNVARSITYPSIPSKESPPSRYGLARWGSHCVGGWVTYAVICLTSFFFFFLFFNLFTFVYPNRPVGPRWWHIVPYPFAGTRVGGFGVRGICRCRGFGNGTVCRDAHSYSFEWLPEPQHTIICATEGEPLLPVNESVTTTYARCRPLLLPFPLILLHCLLFFFILPNLSPLRLICPGL